MTCVLLAAILCGADSDERAREFCNRIRFEVPAPDSEEGRKVARILQDKETWILAYKELERRLGPMPGDLDLKVDFTLEGEEVGWGGWEGGEARVRFNLRQLAERERKMEETEAQRKEALGRGQRLVYRVPPVRMDRLIFHELTHVFQRGCQAPIWFLEGMAQLMGDDPNHLAAFAVAKRKVEAVDEPPLEKADLYARGHLFWKWLDTLGAVQKTADLAVIRQRPWKEAVEEATGFPWAVLLLSERDWSEKEVRKLQAMDPAGR